MRYKRKEPKFFYHLDSRASKKTKRHRIFFTMSYGFLKVDPVTDKPRYYPIKISTGWNIEKDAWDSENNRPKKNYDTIRRAEIIADLTELEMVAVDTYKEMRAELRNSGEDYIEPDPKLLKARILSNLGDEAPIRTIERLTMHIQRMVDSYGPKKDGGSGRWGEGTLPQYKNLITLLKTYEDYRKTHGYERTELILGEITAEDYWDFFSVISGLHKKEEGKEYTQTYVAGICKDLRAVFHDLKTDGFEVGFNFHKRGLKIHAYQWSRKLALTQEELERVINFDPSGSKAWTEAKKYLIISCMTGLRIADMMTLHENEPFLANVKGNQYWMFEKDISKSADLAGDPLEVVVPILKPVKDIIDEHGGVFPSFSKEPVVRRRIKQFLERVGVDRQVERRQKYYPSEEVERWHEPIYVPFRAHDCRSTFITNVEQLKVAKAEAFTHPKENKSIYQSYDMTNKAEVAATFIEDLNAKKNPIFFHEV